MITYNYNGTTKINVVNYLGPSNQRLHVCYDYGIMSPKTFPIMVLGPNSILVV